MTETETLLPCPFCGGTDVSTRADISEDKPHRVYAYHVFCHDCHAHGRNHYRIGWCESHKAACEAWNDRKPGHAPTLDLRNAAIDALAGWKYIRDHHGDLYGVGWDRVQNALEAALAQGPDTSTLQTNREGK